MRTVLALALAAAALAACTRPNPNTCCVTDQQCADLGADELRPCGVGQACAPDFTCVAAECQTSADCADPQAPICTLGLCVGSCTDDTDCADVAGRPYCADDGVCVGCTDASQCSADTEICDAETRACRGCERDDECASGVCIEADGVCALESELLHVQTSGVDTGDCSRQAPCRTIGFAARQVTETRRVIRIVGGFLSVEPQTIEARASTVIDGTGTQVHKPAGAPWLTVTHGTVTLEGIRIEGNTDFADPTIVVQGSLRFAAGTAVHGLVESRNGSLMVRDAQVNAPVYTNGGTVDAMTSVFTMDLNATSTQVAIRRSRFEGQGALLSVNGGLAQVENTLFIQTYELADSIHLTGLLPGSRFHFNTIVNTSGVESDGVALHCDNTADVRNNIFAYRSTNPHTSTDSCRTHYSLYDESYPAGVEHGTANKVAPLSTFFVSLLDRDFRPKAGSPALGSADPGSLVTEDIDGNPRPSPAGTRADIGAFEAQ